ncbi:CDP-diacylglycerol--glycerol-3-phosphate 3-phosphatidyltransferase [Ophidiomyces ophidiicola]|uniref:CDP-diacylglycerol--glycerol-3-phosphate 3-phosphatidyltransferase n=1 Tax=Ophidiomyces ophidiicola TaxID=1387563 RepID=A0ACB8UYG3_9EURO|nr:CDP-diacylglycerol--glycerol-3-phosphate 3-phosphatidyltransferase [Ophidiomyces ophidiicola]KAI1949509.1 CDP-diacylglycerol--glycerol-3-phosphate 3-phosphatidyltransferase [Ophidiomyces ophidiicola]KAI1972499.1 CDP-diacylglycerol--glycerol-3-phosphate 3-phosphatidyltransferase [Ophidiomyces ophidiicola]KAI2008019.1 CDP-diacylglycerol--glycerol-3-phosphate 3-phosphatidyltransferase [Ophidiomyces ophidiicola]KAI2026052.1 CDP-diacylglycerol--glycerol-3-phosphate 3-phosphatidyltransferase [Ophi
MFSRVGSRCLPSCRRRALHASVRVRTFATSPNVAASTFAHSASSSSPLGALTIELDRIAPRFEIHASHIKIIDSPNSFYQTLKQKIKHAKRRIYLSTLYIGRSELELINTISQSLRENPDLTVSILTDCLRGTRESPDPSCASLLASLVEEHGSNRVEIRMFHTPNLVGFRKRHVPKRINEGWGLQHMKLYGIDDEIILSGANLSNDYFTNRLDRYHLFSSKELADYYGCIHDAIGHLSFLVIPSKKEKSGYILEWPTTNTAPSPLEDPEAFRSSASKLLPKLIAPTQTKTPTFSLSDDKTYVYPVAQFTSLLRPDASTEFPAVTSILGALSNNPDLENSKWLFTAGYFNIHPALSSLLINSTASSTIRQAQGVVLTASPWANGFYGSSGVSGMLPAGYTHLSSRFLDRVAAAQKTNSIQLKEWRRGTVGEPGGWTYHAKGLWITLPNEKFPSLTVVGSSNYTKRSYSLDLEVGAVVVTSNEQLKQRLGEEAMLLQEDAKEISREDFRKVERRVGWHVRLAMWIVNIVGGAM